MARRYSRWLLLAALVAVVPDGARAGSCLDRDQQISELELVSVTIDGEPAGDLAPWTRWKMYLEGGEADGSDDVQLVRRGPDLEFRGVRHFRGAR